MKCKSCGYDVDFKSAKEKRIKIQKGNPSYYFVCPNCGAKNHVKCRHKDGKRRKITIASK